MPINQESDNLPVPHDLEKASWAEDLDLIDENDRNQRLPTVYNEGYQVARSVDLFGKATRVIGWCLGLVLLGLTDVAGDQLRQLPAFSSWITANLHLNPIELVHFVGVILAIVTIIIFVVLGTIVSALGQMAKSVTDTAVNTSPFFSDTQKLRLIVPDTLLGGWWKVIQLLVLRLTRKVRAMRHPK